MSKNFKKRPSPLSSGVFMDNWLHKKVHHQAPETIVNNDEETEGNDSLTMDAHLQPVEEEEPSRAYSPDDGQSCVQNRLLHAKNLVHQLLHFCVQNSLKLTYWHQRFQKIFRGLYPGPPF
jgi:hypothetical protein